MEEEGIQRIFIECSKIVNNLLLALASIELTDQEILQQGNELISRFTEGFNMYAKGLNIRQSSKDPPGSFWTEGLLGNFLYSVLRLIFEVFFFIFLLVSSYHRFAREKYDKNNPLERALEDSDLKWFDRLREFDRNQQKENGPGKVIKVGHIAVPEPRRIDIQDKITCPDETCQKTYDSEKAFNRHLRKEHIEDIER